MTDSVFYIKKINRFLFIIFLDNTVQGVPGNEQLPPHDASKSFEFSEGSSTKENSSQLFSYEKRLKKKGKEVDANSNYSSQEGQYLTGAGWPRGR